MRLLLGFYFNLFFNHLSYNLPWSQALLLKMLGPKNIVRYLCNVSKNVIRTSLESIKNVMNPANIYLFKVMEALKKCEICSKLTI